MKTKSPIILIVEDEQLLLDVIARKLESSGMSAISCRSGREALEVLESAKELPHVIWLDYYLKDMNGLEFMNALKANKRWLHIPTIVVSNSASPINVSHMLALGVKKYYLKAEHRLDDIIDAIKEIVQKENKTTMEKSKKILIVDDEVLVIKALTKKLKESGFEVEEALDGQEALLKVEKEKPDLILLDIIMPKLDGISVLKRLKESKATQNIPILILTNLYDDKKMTEVLRTGDTDYLIKVEHPLDDIISRVKQKLRS